MRPRRRRHELTSFEHEDDEYGRLELDDLVETLQGVQDDHLELIERAIPAMVKHSPSRELETTIFDEESRCPPWVKSAIITDVLAQPPDVLPDIDVPTLVCAGADEKWRSVASVKAVADEIPDAQFELFEESGHCITIEEPDRFNRVLREFVESLG